MNQENGGMVSVFKREVSYFSLLIGINRSFPISYETCATSPYNPAGFYFLSSSGTIIPVCRQQYPRYTHPDTSHDPLRTAPFHFRNFPHLCTVAPSVCTHLFRLHCALKPLRNSQAPRRSLFLKSDLYLGLNQLLSTN
jgi:hypothetical protein